MIQFEHRVNDSSALAGSPFANLLDPQGCLGCGGLVDAAPELHQRTPPAIASFDECALQFGAGTNGDRERALTRGEPPLDVGEHFFSLEAEHPVEKQRLRMRTDRERRRIAEVERSKSERAHYVGRCSREEVEYRRQLDPLEVVHASSLLVVDGLHCFGEWAARAPIRSRSALIRC